MKKTKIASIALAALLLLAAFAALFVAAEDTSDETAIVYYPNGTVIFQESDFKNAADLSTLFKVATGSDVQISFNTETDRLQIVAPSNNTVVDMIGVPKNIGNYTMVADLYLTGNDFGNNALFGIGINSGSAWSRSSYFQCNVYTADPAKYWFNNYNPDGTGGAGGAGAVAAEKYELGTKVTVKIVVTPETVAVYYNDTFLSILKTEKLGYELGSGSPFFLQRGKTTLEIDNLLIYSGTGEPDYTKTMANQQPLTEPETEAPAETDPPATEPPATDPVQTDPQDSDTTSKPEDTKAPAGESSSESTSSAADDGNKKSGCGSVIGIGAVGVVAALGAVFAGASRRRRK